VIEMFNEHELRLARIVYLSYEDGKPTLWDSDALGRMKAAWLERASDGAIIVSTDESAIELAEGFND
jgi:hypothetical protein